MKSTLVLLVAVLFTLAACTTQPLVPENNDSNDSAAELPDYTSPLVPVEEPDEEPEPTTPPADFEPAEPVDTSEYAAVVEAIEGELVKLQTRATDPDGDEVTLMFDAPLDENGEWQTTEGDAGEYEVTVTASDGRSETEAVVLIIVNTANQAPVITGPATLIVDEGDEVDLGVFTITDAEDDEIIVSYAGWMSASTRQTTFSDAGEYSVRIIAEDSMGNAAVEEVTVVVVDKNRKPVLSVADSSLEATEGDLLVIEATATDADGDDVEITFDAPFDENGEWQTVEGDAGEYEVEVTAGDGVSQVTRTVRVTVSTGNMPPVIEIDSTINVDEGETIDLEAEANIFDPEGEDVVVEYSGWMTSSMYTATFDDAGSYTVVITADDGEKTSSATIEIVVADVNRAPVFIRPA